jgi:hypothetical protein
LTAAHDDSVPGVNEILRVCVEALERLKPLPEELPDAVVPAIEAR